MQPLEVSFKEGWTGDRIKGSTMRFNECPHCTVERICNKVTEKEITYNLDAFYTNTYTAYINNEIMTEETAKKYHVENLRRASTEEFYQLLSKQREK